MASTIQTVSGHLLYLSAAKIPNKTPATKEITIATPPSFAEDGKEYYEKYFDVLMKYDSKVIGGKLPDEEIYFKK